MKKMNMIAISLAVMAMALWAPDAAAQATQNVNQLERDIELHEKNIKDK